MLYALSLDALTKLPLTHDFRGDSAHGFMVRLKSATRGEPV
jgi:hypothetical protein